MASAKSDQKSCYDYFFLGKLSCQSMVRSVEALISVNADPLEFLDTLSPEVRELVSVLRAIVKRIVPQIQEFVFESPQVKWNRKVASYALASFPPRRRLLEAVLDLTQRIHEDFTFDPMATEVRTPVSDVFEMRRGVCQDFAHLQIACLRSLGLAARYVSGYNFTNSSSTDHNAVTSEASHAWISVYFPEFSVWVDIDPTNNHLVSSFHATLAWGRDYSDVSPIRGVILGGGNHRLTVNVSLKINEDSGKGEEVSLD